MAKVNSAERVSPITRANYSGNPNDLQSPEGYDPLAALASLVGNIESEAAAENLAADKPNVDLESELIKDFGTVDNYSPDQAADLGDMEDELSYALEAGLQSVTEESPPSGEEGLEPLLTAPENDYDAPVLQSFASLQSAFGVEPQPDMPQAEEGPTAGGGSGDELMVSQLLQELSLDQSQQPDAAGPDIGGQIDLDDLQGFTTKNTTVPPIEQFTHAQPIAENSPVGQHNGLGNASPSNPEPFAHVPVTDTPFQPMAAADGFGGQPDPAASEDFTSEFEAAMSGSAAELLGQPPFLDSLPLDAGIPVARPELAPEITPEFANEDNPFGTLEEAAVMPTATTPFDNQVDDALSDIIETEIRPDSEFGWSGDLGVELDHIVALTPGEEAEIQISSPDAADFAAPPESAEVAPFEQEIHADFTALPSSAELETPDQNFLPPADISAFEKELEEQLNPEFNDDLSVGIPLAPEFADEPVNKRGGMGVAIGVLSIACIVAAGAFSWKYISDGTKETSVPTIFASTDPVKIKPKEPGGIKIPNQDQVVFEQVNGNNESKTSQERLASGAETPIRVITTDLTPPVVQPLPVSGSVSSSETGIAKSGARVAPGDTILVRTEQAIISPRRVRTVVVRPDGTLVAAKPAASAKKTAGKIEPVKVASTAKINNFVEPVTGSIAKAGPPVVTPLPIEAPARVTRSAVPIRKVEVVPVKPLAQSSGALRPTTAPVEIIQTKPVAIAAPRKVKIQQIKKVAAPKRIVQPKKAKPASRPVKLATASTGAYVMQISSQRSAQAAQSSYNRLSRKFAGVLGGRGVDIRRFKLKDKGIYYRVRIPVGSKKSAIQLCTRYKSVGGSCFVTR